MCKSFLGWGTPPGNGTSIAKRCESGDFEATNLRDCCTPDFRMAKWREHGNIEARNPRVSRSVTPDVRHPHTTLSEWPNGASVATSRPCVCVTVALGASRFVPPPRETAGGLARRSLIKGVRHRQSEPGNMQLNVDDGSLTSKRPPMIMNLVMITMGPLGHCDHWDH